MPAQVLPHERQLEVMHEQVREALTRIGHLDGFELDEIVPAEQLYGIAAELAGLQGWERVYDPPPWGTRAWTRAAAAAERGPVADRAALFAEPA